MFAIPGSLVSHIATYPIIRSSVICLHQGRVISRGKTRERKIYQVNLDLRLHGSFVCWTNYLSTSEQATCV